MSSSGTRPIRRDPDGIDLRVVPSYRVTDPEYQSPLVTAENLHHNGLLFTARHENADLWRTAGFQTELITTALPQTGMH